MRPRKKDLFVDLGSGTGRAVLTAAALYKLGGALGIEIQPRLHLAATQAAARIDWGAVKTKKKKVEFRCEDGLGEKESWSNCADLVFCTTTCFTDEMLELFTARAAGLKKGARLCITTRGLKSKQFELVRSGVLPYAKGALTFYVYRRV